MYICRRCGAQCDEGDVCQQCGTRRSAAEESQYSVPLYAKEQERHEETSMLPIWAVVLIVGGFLFLLLAGYGIYMLMNFAESDHTERAQLSQEADYSGGQDAYSSYDAAQDLEDKLAYQRERGVFREGFYEVGKDVPAGEYVVLCDDNAASPNFYMGVYVSASQSEESQLFGGWYETSRYVVLEEGLYIDLTHATLYDPAKNDVPLDPFANGGMYKVGTDLDAGTYIVANSSDQYTATYSVYSSINSVSIITKTSGIISVGEETEITVEDGEYIEMKFCHLK